MFSDRTHRDITCFCLALCARSIQPHEATLTRSLSKPASTASGPQFLNLEEHS